jgi:hypothetical protein
MNVCVCISVSRKNGRSVAASRKKRTVGGCNGKASDVSTSPAMIRTGDLALMSQSPQHPSPPNPARPELENSQDPKRTMTVQYFCSANYVEAHSTDRKSLM